MSINKSPILIFAGKTLLAALPILALICWYAVSDPFGVVHNRHSGIPVNHGVTLAVNYGFVSTELFDRYNATMRYDSFIFGSSMSQYYKADYWKCHLPSNARIYHFDASMETIDGIINKINYINSKGTIIKHALIIMEEAMLHRQPQDESILYAQHYATTPKCDYLNFQKLYFNTFRNPAFIKFTLNPEKNKDEMVASHYASTDIQDRNDPINESFYARFDSLIANDPGAFFTPERMKSRTFVALPTAYPNRIGNTQAEKLTRLWRLLEANHCDYMVIIPPRYHRKQVNRCDLFQLQCIFGNDHVFDFSHDSSLCNDLKAYYDNDAHLISAKCKEILDSSYMMREGSLPSPFTKKADIAVNF